MRIVTTDKTKERKHALQYQHLYYLFPDIRKEIDEYHAELAEQRAELLAQGYTKIMRDPFVGYIARG